MTWQQVVGGISGALSVGLGAYGAHGMMGRAENFKTSFETGVRYQMVHSALLVATPAICGSNTRAANIAGLCFTTGILLFSGSCCAVGLFEDRSYGKLAPYGGFSFIGGWLALALLSRGKVKPH
mmetsp:Transcript_32716/g.47337  ORF Transcript_32716/g.47337 Transcript_32716/m.47337 type:complete len:124 (-) Transcript_32716:198-569(-)